MTLALAGSALAPKQSLADTREMLLLMAIRLFAENGVDRISLQTISLAAGNRNKSAVGYHFKNKQGLIDAVLHRLGGDLEPAIRTRIAAFEAALANGEKPSLNEIVLGLLEPVLLLYATTDYAARRDQGAGAHDARSDG